MTLIVPTQRKLLSGNFLAGTEHACLICRTLPQLITDTGWNEAAPQYQFQRGTQEESKDEMARVENPAGLDVLISLAIQIDDQLQEQREEKKVSLQPPGPHPGPAAHALSTKPIQRVKNSVSV